MEKNETWFEKKISWQISIIAVVLGASYFIWSQMATLDKSVALQNQKLDTLIAWSVRHDNDTATLRQNLNVTFADIYEKLGEKFTP
jgi:hypothetical protein